MNVSALLKRYEDLSVSDLDIGRLSHEGRFLTPAVATL